MQAKHIFNGHIYLISSHSVARNPLFHNRELCSRFLRKLDHYLGPLCEILQYSLLNHEFQLVLKIRSREKFCIYYREKHEKDDLSEEEIPFSTYIFSQAMANLLASAAIHFNRKYGRTGALFARRFYKQLITSKEDLERHLSRLSKMKCLMEYSQRWRVRGNKAWGSKKRRKMSRSIERSGFKLNAKNQHMHPFMGNFTRYFEGDLQGQFENLPELHLDQNNSQKYFRYKAKNNHSPP